MCKASVHEGVSKLGIVEENVVAEKPKRYSTAEYLHPVASSYRELSVFA
jgi:hypothetical protein